MAGPLLGQIAIELAATLTVLGTALFGSQALSERAFRLLRWIANRAEPPELAATPAEPGVASHGASRGSIPAE